MPRSSHVDSTEAGRVLQFCANILKLLNLPQHELVLDDEPCMDGAYAEIHPTKDRFAARVAVCEDWESLPVDRKMSVLTHEMLHLTHAELFSDVSELLRRSSSVSVDLHVAVETILHAHCERWVDRMTWVVTNGYELKYPKKIKGEVRKVA